MTGLLLSLSVKKYKAKEFAFASYRRFVNVLRLPDLQQFNADARPFVFIKCIS